MFKIDNRYRFAFHSSFHVFLYHKTLPDCDSLLVSAQHGCRDHGTSIFAWFQMTHDLSREMPLWEAVKLVTDGEEDCDICKFCKENNPMEDGGQAEMVPYKSQLLYLSPIPTCIINSPAGHSKQWEPHYPIFSGFVTGIEPPPPKSLV